MLSLLALLVVPVASLPFRDADHWMLSWERSHRIPHPVVEVPEDKAAPKENLEENILELKIFDDENQVDGEIEIVEKTREKKEDEVREEDLAVAASTETSAEIVVEKQQTVETEQNIVQDFIEIPKRKPKVIDPWEFIKKTYVDASNRGGGSYIILQCCHEGQKD